MFKSQKVFLVDDDPFCRQLIEYAIRGAGYDDVQAFDNGAACLDALTEEPTIIFLDQMMGSVSGTDALKTIKRFNPDIYVVLVSGQQQVQVAVDSLKYGAFDYVVKDERLAERLATVLAKIERLQVLLASRRPARPRFLSVFSLLSSLLALVAGKSTSS
jgi:DNA-binding NtrC family response regulator